MVVKYSITTLKSTKERMSQSYTTGADEQKSHFNDRALFNIKVL